MIAQAHLTATHIEVTSPMRLGPKIKEIPGSRYAGADLWKLPRTMHALVQLFGHLGPEHLELSPEMAAWGAEAKAHEAELLVLRAAALSPDAWPEPTAELRGYQATAVAYLDAAGSVVLGDDPGSGKTRMALAWAQNFPALVVCPKAVQQQWLDEFDRVHPGNGHMVLDGTATQRRKQLAAFAALESQGALIVTYSQLPLHSRLAPYGSVRLVDKEKDLKELNAIEWRDVIADEVHRAFNPVTKWTRALWWLGHHAERRLGMTGTPSEKSPLDLWALLHFVDPKGWPSRSKFQDFYCETRYQFWGGSEVTGLRADRRDEFERLRDLTFLRRQKSLILPNLPRKQRVNRYLDLPVALKKQYSALVKEMTADVQGGTLEVFDPLVLWGRLIQAASATLAVDESTGAVSLTEPSPKIDALLETLEDYGNPPCAVFAASRQLLDLTCARLEKLERPYAAVVGGMSSAEIAVARDAYNSGAVDLILISLGAAAEGLNLTRGSTEIFLDRSYRQVQNGQAEDRMHGIGRGDQEADHLTIIDLVTRGTVEERRAHSLAEKGERFTALFDSPAEFLEEA